MDPDTAPARLWALVRLDLFLGTLSPNSVTVKAIFVDKDVAETEAARLNALNGTKGVQYFVQATRRAEAAP